MNDRIIEVFNPYTRERVGSVPKASVDEVRAVLTRAHAHRPRLTRYERARILNSLLCVLCVSVSSVLKEDFASTPCMASTGAAGRLLLTQRTQRHREHRGNFDMS